MGGKTELAEYGFDYRDLYQRWNGAFYQLPIPLLHVLYSRRLTKPFFRERDVLENPWVCPMSTVRGSVSIWGLMLVDHSEPLH